MDKVVDSFFISGPVVEISAHDDLNHALQFEDVICRTEEKTKNFPGQKFLEVVPRKKYEADLNRLRQEIASAEEMIRADEAAFGLLRMLSDRHGIPGGSVANLPNIYKNAEEAEERARAWLKKRGGG